MRAFVNISWRTTIATLFESGMSDRAKLTMLQVNRERMLQLKAFEEVITVAPPAHVNQCKEEINPTSNSVVKHFAKAKTAGFDK